MAGLLCGAHTLVIADYLEKIDLLSLAQSSRTTKKHYRCHVVRDYKGPWPQPRLLEFSGHVRKIHAVKSVHPKVVDLSKFWRLHTVCLDFEALVSWPASIRNLTFVYSTGELPITLQSLTIRLTANAQVPQLEHLENLDALDMQTPVPTQGLRLPPNLRSLKLRAYDNPRNLVLPESLRDLTLVGAELPKFPTGLTSLVYQQRYDAPPQQMDLGDTLRELTFSGCRFDANTLRLPPGLESLTVVDSMHRGMLHRVPQSLVRLNTDGRPLLSAQRTNVKVLVIAVYDDDDTELLDNGFALTCPHVTHLDLTFLSTRPVERFFNSLPLAELRRLDIKIGCSDEVVQMDFARMPHLERLRYDGRESFTPATIACCTKLKRLHVPSLRVGTRELLPWLPASLQRLRALMPMADVCALESATQLTSLRLLEIEARDLGCEETSGTLLRTSELPRSLERLSVKMPPSIYTALSGRTFRLVGENAACCDTVILHRAAIQRFGAITWKVSLQTPFYSGCAKGNWDRSQVVQIQQHAS